MPPRLLALGLLAAALPALTASAGPSAVPAAPARGAASPAKAPSARPAAPVSATASTPRPGGASAAAAPPVETILLDDFRKRFLADAGKVRLVLLFSPT